MVAKVLDESPRPFYSLDELPPGAANPGHPVAGPLRRKSRTGSRSSSATPRAWESLRLRPGRRRGSGRSPWPRRRARQRRERGRALPRRPGEDPARPRVCGVALAAALSPRRGTPPRPRPPTGRRSPSIRRTPPPTSGSRRSPTSAATAPPPAAPWWRLSPITRPRPAGSSSSPASPAPRRPARARPTAAGTILALPAAHVRQARRLRAPLAASRPSPSSSTSTAPARSTPPPTSATPPRSMAAAAP